LSGGYLQPKSLDDLTDNRKFENKLTLLTSSHDELDRRFRWIFITSLLTLTIWAFSHCYPTDDAYISFRYAKHLVEGQGLVWNLGEKVEGYSNFLWLLMVAAGMRLGLHPETAAALWNIPIFTLALILTYILAQRILNDRWAALAAMVLTGLNHSIWGFARSGLETLLITMLFVAAACLVERIVSKGRNGEGGQNEQNGRSRQNGWHFLGLGIVLNLALLTRLDAGLLVLWAVWCILRCRPAVVGGALEYRCQPAVVGNSPILPPLAGGSKGGEKCGISPTSEKLGCTFSPRLKQDVMGVSESNGCQLERVDNPCESASQSEESQNPKSKIQNPNSTHPNYNWLFFITPFVVLFLPYLIWKWSYYGVLAPNPARVKIHGLTGFEFGVYYIYMFALSTLLIPHLTLLIGKARWMVKHHPAAGRNGLLTLVWFIYAAWVGGDFMEFRFLAPVLPMLTILLVWVSLKLAPSRRIGRWLLLALALGIIHNWFSLNRFVFSYGMETAKELRNHLIHPAQNWIGVGKRLNQLFGGTTVKLSAGAAGAIPYYADLETVDFIGLTDPVIPKIGEEFTKVPGHRIIAPVEYLYQRGVNLFIEPNNFVFDQVEFNNWLRTATWAHTKRLYVNLDRPVNGRQIDHINLLVIPIDSQYILAAWYMQPHPEIDRIAREQGFRQVKISRW